MFELIVTLTVAGCALLFLEVFLPGMIAGAIGALALVVAIVLSYVHYGADAGHWMLGSVLILVIVLFVWWMRTFFQTRIGRKWMLQTAVPNAPAPVVTIQNAVGEAMTALRPAGTALIGGSRVDVLAESELIESGAAIRVVRVEGPKVVVRRV